MLVRTCRAPTPFWSRTAVELGLAGLELDPGALELGLLRRDLVACGLDPRDRLAGLVAQAAHPADDRGVLILDPLQVLVAGDQVVEAVGLEHHGERVGLAGAVDLDEPVAQDVERAPELSPQALEVLRFSSRSRRCTSIELGLDDRLAVAKHRDLARKLVHLVAVALELGGEHPLLLLGVELAFLGVELGLQVLTAGGRHGEADGDQRAG